jgi:hypothetical protein
VQIQAERTPCRWELEEEMTGASMVWELVKIGLVVDDDEFFFKFLWVG